MNARENAPRGRSMPYTLVPFTKDHLEAAVELYLAAYAHEQR